MRTRLLLLLSLVPALIALPGCGVAPGGDALAYHSIHHRGHHFRRHGSHGAKWSQALAYAAAYHISGIDVSKFQGKIDWDKVKDSGVKFAWIKSTEGGDRVDDNFRANWRESAEAGVPRGAYHFVYWCRDPLSQIKWFEKNVPADPHALPPVLDVELTPTSPTCKRILHRRETVREIGIMLAEMKRFYHKTPIIYSTVDFYRGILSGGALSQYPIWVRSTKYKPQVAYGSRPWRFWQYQSDGHVQGVPGRVDRNAFYGNDKQWLAFLGKKEAGPAEVDIAQRKSTPQLSSGPHGLPMAEAIEHQSVSKPHVLALHVAAPHVLASTTGSQDLDPILNLSKPKFPARRHRISPIPASLFEPTSLSEQPVQLGSAEK